jgi:predicted MPP superfamily phosphohydrolase
MSRTGKVLLLAALVVSVLCGGVVVWAFLESRAPPIVRRADLALADWPAGQPPITVALLSDLHVGNASTDAARLTRVVAQADALHPDLILLAGDFLPGHHAMSTDRIRTLLAPLSGLHAPLGVVAVLGNHDYLAGEATIRPALPPLGVTLLVNQAVRRGPLAIGGLDDPVTGHAAVDVVMTELRRLGGARLVLAHSPEIVAALPTDAPLLLAGHTHCGQIGLPLLDPQGPHGRYRRYNCGLVHDPGRTVRGRTAPGRTVIVAAGIGTSVLPLRLGAPPDFWLLTLGPAATRSPLSPQTAPRRP